MASSSILAVLVLLSLSLPTLGNEVNSPFVVGDTWRGHLSQCEKRVFSGADSTPHIIDMTVQSVGEGGLIDVLFTEQTTKTQYIMTGTYESNTGQLDLSFGGEVRETSRGGSCVELLTVLTPL